MSALAAVSAFALALTSCGGEDAGSSGSGDGGEELSGDVGVDGSSTVAPLSSAAAALYAEEQPQVNVTVGTSGTGGGFEKFCNGETDISDASRPIKDEEIAACEANSISYAELIVANDALTVVVNPAVDFVDCLTVEQLNAIWGPDSTIANWSEVDPSFPDLPLDLYGAGTDSGTFDYFTDVINGEEGASRSDYSATEDDNVTVQGVSGDRGALGYFGFSYFEENQDQLKALEVDGGGGCVAPSVAAAQDDSYTPLSRPLFVYANQTSFDDNEDLRNFVKFMFDNNEAIATGAQFVPLSGDQIAEQLAKFEDATS